MQFVWRTTGTIYTRERGRESEEEGRDTERVQQGKCIIIVVSGLQCMRHTHVNRILLLLVREAEKTTIER